MGSKKSVVIGYKYYMGIHMGACRGPVDELVEITADGKQIYKGNANQTQTIYIDKPGLFGGEKKEGGIQGSLHLMMGEKTQQAPSALKSMLGGDVPAFRGIVSLFYDGLIAAMNPYIKPWKIRLRRTTKGWDGDNTWYAGKATIPLKDGQIHAMNPAHIIYECLTNRDWGGGMDRSLLSDASFRLAADRLAQEGFGLCIRWTRQEAVKSFVETIVNHIGASLYQSRFDGLFYLDLIRDDYDVDSLPYFDEENGLLTIEEDDNGASSGAVNELILRWHDPITDNDRQWRERNLAAIHSDGQVITTSLDYSGIPTEELAGRVANRELAQRAANLKRFKVKLDRRGWRIEPGKPLRISSKRRGINNLIVRAGRVEDGTLSSGEMTITVVQDVFGMPAQSISEAQPPQWVAPDRTPQVAYKRKLIERNWRDIVSMTTEAEVNLIPSTACYLTSLAIKPTSLHQNYDLETRVGVGAWENKDTASFAELLRLSIAIDALNNTLFVSGDMLVLSDVEVGSAAIIGDEIVRIDYIDVAAGQIKVGRGCVDTVPTAHDAGSEIWFYDDTVGIDQTEYAPSTTVQARVITRTSEATLNPVLAAIDSLTMQQRQARPYPPANVKINGEYYPSQVQGSIIITWAHRDRLLQADQMIDYYMQSIGPEPETTYTVRLLRKDNNTLLASTTAMAATTTTIETDYQGEVVLELYSERNGLRSWQSNKITFAYTPSEM
ncbi:phage tail protein [Pseudomonas sp. F1_0610]|uniref:phage tail protein n=1 Tax=Pseudomonas sp. F1_0610 TaxID=3114284 RepID=UPI0039C4495A